MLVVAMNLGPLTVRQLRGCCKKKPSEFNSKNWNAENHLVFQIVPPTITFIGPKSAFGGGGYKPKVRFK